MADRLVVRGAREHNLKDVSLDLPRDALIVFTGLSGSGKSSLAFDTIFAEGQRRYVESLSAYARQFLGQMDKPDVDFIEGLSPAVSIDQKSTSRNPRSTVGTITEVYDYLRLLFARAGRPHCPVCGRPIARQTPQQIVDRVLELDEGTRFQVLAPVVRGRKGEYADLFRTLHHPGLQPGPGRRRDPLAVRAAAAEEAGEAHDRGGRRPAGGEGERQAPAHRLGRDRAAARRGPRGPRLRRPARGRPRARAHVLRAPGLPVRRPVLRGARAAVVLVQLPYGACPECTGLGTRMEVDPELLVPDPGAVARRGRDRAVGVGARRRLLRPAARRAGRRDGLLGRRALAATVRPTRSRRCCTATSSRCTSATATATAASARYWTTFEGVIPYVERRHAEAESDTSRERFEGYMREVPCPACGGTRLKPVVACGHDDGGRRRRAQHRRGLRAADRAGGAVAGRARPDAARAPDRRAGAQGDQRAAAVPARRRPRLPHPRPAVGLAVRRRGAADPAGHPDRLRPGRGAVRPRRAVDRPAPARQPPADRDAAPAARPRQHADRRRARRGHHPHRRLGRRHRARRRRARRAGRRLRHGRRTCSTTTTR